jgi:hypothetical protein
MAHAPNSALTDQNPEVHHEDSDVNVRAIFGFALGLIVTGIAVHLIVWLLFQFLNQPAGAGEALSYPLSVGQENRVPPEPRLQTNPRDDLRMLHVHEDELLTTYGWVDKASGVVRIPVDEALKITAQQGLPTRPANGEKK